jgi:hypothetical protein
MSFLKWLAANSAQINTSFSESSLHTHKVPLPTVTRLGKVLLSFLGLSHCLMTPAAIHTSSPCPPSSLTSLTNWFYVWLPNSAPVLNIQDVNAGAVR